MDYSYKPREIPWGDINKLTTAIKLGQENANKLWGDELISDKFLNSIPITQSYAYCLVRSSTLSDQIDDAIFNQNFEDGKGLLRHQIEDRTLLETFIYWHETLHNSLSQLDLDAFDDCFIKIMPNVVPFYFNFVVDYSEKFLGQRNVIINQNLLNKWLKRTPSSFLSGMDERGIPDTPTSYRGIELNSPGHKRLCEKLAANKIMFMIEAPTFIPSDTKNYRKIDLVVVKDDRALIVEIDGSRHLGQQREDDYLRDYAIDENWSNHIRFSHREVQDELDLVFKKIMKKLNKNYGDIRN